MAQAFKERLIKKIGQILRNYSRVACEQVRQQWSRYDVDGEAEIDYKVEDVETVVTAFIWAAGQKAWLLEYGKGSKMERSTTENPFLAEYLSGSVTGIDGEPLFNPDRLQRGLAIIGRPFGFYLDLDDVIHFASGYLEGALFEPVEGRKFPFTFEPLPPRKIIKNVLFGQNNDGLIAEINKEIANAIIDTAVEIMSNFPKEIVLMRG